MRRALTILGRELQLQQRYGVLYAALVVVGLWAAVFAFLEEPTRRFLLPPVIVMDTAIFGFFLMTAMMFLEKSDRVLAAIVVSPLSTGRYLLNKVLSLTIVAVALTALLVAILTPSAVNWALLVVGVAIGSVMTMLAGFVLAARFESMNTYIIPSALLLTVVQLPALHYFEIATSKLFYALPTMAPLALVRGAFAPLPAWEVAYALAYGLLSCVLLHAWARRTFDRFVVGGAAGWRPTQARAARSDGRRRGPIAALVAADLRNVRRDPLLVFMASYALILALLGRWLVPWLVEVLEPTFDLRPYVLLIVTFFAVQTGPLLLGAVSGLMLLDERDENSLTSLRVTPLPIGRYALYRASGPILLSTALCFAGVYFVGLVDAPPLRIAAVAVVNALEAPIISLALVSLAGNKVEGMALMKGMGIFMFAPVIGWFVDPPMRWLIGVIPTLWPAEAFWQAVEPRGSFWPVIAVGLVSHLLLLWLLLRRFRRRL
ncbi:MAG: hypothetical protein KC486_23240 [Myxococcales bacterium]|nr:hypothetical protein [Myxococcales bacterium]